jgi:hypothetical protein
MAESDGLNGGDLSDSKKTSQGGIVRIIGPNAPGGSFNSIQHSRGTVAAIDKGVSELSIDSERVKSRAGNATKNMHESRIPCKFGYFNGDANGGGSRENAHCPHENTNHFPLITHHLYTVHNYNGGDLIACFEESISEKAIREIANRKPLRAVFRDSSFTSSPEKINVTEIFKLLAPNTSVKVI